eukprot:1238742-Prymnesium_polylepis.2
MCILLSVLLYCKVSTTAGLYGISQRDLALGWLRRAHLDMRIRLTRTLHKIVPRARVPSDAQDAHSRWVESMLHSSRARSWLGVLRMTCQGVAQGRAEQLRRLLTAVNTLPKWQRLSAHLKPEDAITSDRLNRVLRCLASDLPHFKRLFDAHATADGMTLKHWLEFRRQQDDGELSPLSETEATALFEEQVRREPRAQRTTALSQVTLSSFKSQPRSFKSLLQISSRSPRRKIHSRPGRGGKSTPRPALSSSRKSSGKSVDLPEYKQAVELPSISLSQFVQMLLTPQNSMVDPAKVVLAEEDMHLPLTHYWVNTTHKSVRSRGGSSFLTGHQLYSRSSSDMYRRQLLAGVRSLEIDCCKSSRSTSRPEHCHSHCQGCKGRHTLDLLFAGDGPHGEPRVTHGHTLCSSITFAAVVIAISETAFETSHFPVMLSLEMVGPRKPEPGVLGVRDG